jgi:hypothetical protein
MNTERPDRTALLRRQGTTESAFAVLTAVLLLGSTASPGIVVMAGALAVWMAWRGRRMVELAVPLADAERRELEHLAADSRHVREQPVRFDLLRCRRLAQVESLLDGRT